MPVTQQTAVAAPVARGMIFCTSCGSGLMRVYHGNTFANIMGAPATAINLAVVQFDQRGIMPYTFTTR